VRALKKKHWDELTEDVSDQVFSFYGSLIHLILERFSIEGAEKSLIASIDDFSIIKRFVISCHDFRADHGEGESYRTKKFVVSMLAGLGYKIKTFSYGISWSDDWIFATME